MQTWGVHIRVGIAARYVFVLNFAFVFPLGNVAWPLNKFQVTQVAAIQTIPSFSVDKTLTEVMAQLREMNIDVDTVAEPSCLPVRKFVRTEPESGSMLYKGGRVVVFYSKGPPPAGTIVQIPAFKDQRASNVTKTLERLLLRVNEKSRPSALAEGTFLTTEPIAGKDVAACSEIVVVASSGIAPVNSSIPLLPSNTVTDPGQGAAISSAPKSTELLRVPDLVRMPRKSAEMTLRKSGFKPTKQPQFEYAANIARNHVIRTEPPSDSELLRDSEVAIYYSLGQELIRIPVLQGTKIKSAVQTLEEIGFAPTGTMGEFSDKIPLQEVMRTGPPGGSEHFRGTSVTVYYSLGPEPFWNRFLRWLGELPMWAKWAAVALVAITAATQGWRRLKPKPPSPAPAMPGVSRNLVHGTCEIHTPNGPALQISISGRLGPSEVPNLRFIHDGSTS